MSQPQPPWNPEGQQGQQSYPGEQYGPPSPQGPYQQQPGWPPQGQPPYIPPGSQTAQDNLPPSCVPGARQDDTTGLADASKPAIDYQNVISELSAGSYSVATGDTSAADAVIGTAISKVRAGGNAVSAFGTG